MALLFAHDSVADPLVPVAMRHVQGLMSGRRAQVIETAIVLLGTVGERGTSHHSIDCAADVPKGTTSNKFRTRDALLATLCVEIERRRTEILEQFLHPKSTASLEDLAQALIRYVTEMSSVSPTPASILSRAHRSMCTLAQHSAALRGFLASSAQNHVQVLHQAICAVEPSSTSLRSQVIADYMIGVIAGQLAIPNENFNPGPGLRALLTTPI